MQAQASSSPSHHERVRNDSNVRGPQAAVLTGCAVAIGAAFGLTLGPLAVVLYAITIPVPMMLLWLSADVRRSDER